MDRDALRPILVAVVCVLAISVAAATLTSPVNTESSGGGGFDSPSSDQSDDSGVGGQDDSESPSGGGFDFPEVCLSLFSGDAPFGVLSLTLLLFGAFMYSRYDGLVAFSFVLGAGIPLFLVLFLLTAGCAEPFSVSSSVNATGIPLGEGNGSSSPVGFGDGEGPVDPTSPSTLLFVLLALTPVVLVGLYLFSDVETDRDEDEETLDRTDEERRSAIGRAAGRAADRIEDSVDVENEVYRAWREMTDHLDVDRPESSTPGEFADAAADAGMTEADVEELTTLFEEVRYGGRDPTADREERAVAALRRIETAYAEDER